MKYQSTFRDDPEYLPLIQSFTKRLPWYVHSIETCLANNNPAEALKLVHQLKGAGGGYGFPEITRLAGVAEQSLKASPTDRTATTALLDYIRNVDGYISQS